MGPLAGSQCFPFYTYAPDGSERRENITDWALAQFRERYGPSPKRKRGSDEVEAGGKPSLTRRARTDAEITKWDIFWYVYGLLHHPGYRARYADCLRRELPRIPFAPDFWAFADAGKELGRLHLDYEKLEPWPLEWVESPDVPLSYRVEKMKLTKDKRAVIVNPSLTLRALPPECFEYRLGNRSALEWVIDQYQVKEDARSGIRSDPNRADDPEYIVRLVGQVVRVSVETVRIVKGLPGEFGAGKA
jgi:predicted helicase